MGPKHQEAFESFLGDSDIQPGLKTAVLGQCFPNSFKCAIKSSKKSYNSIRIIRRWPKILHF